jgi:hypothetical protein
MAEHTFPKYVDEPHGRPILDYYGSTPLGELIWVALLALPVIGTLLLILFD